MNLVSDFWIERTDISNILSVFPVQQPKPWPPPSKVPFFIGDYSLPKKIDVDVMSIKFLSVNDPAFLVDYASDDEIHAALAVTGSPVAQGTTATASASAFRQWVVNFFVAISPHCRMPRQSPLTGFSDCCFQRLSNLEAIQIANVSIDHTAWMLQVLATAGARTGVAFQLFPSHGGGGGHCSLQGSESRVPVFLVP